MVRNLVVLGALVGVFAVVGVSDVLERRSDEGTAASKASAVVRSGTDDDCPPRPEEVEAVGASEPLPNLENGDTAALENELDQLTAINQEYAGFVVGTHWQRSETASFGVVLSPTTPPDVEDSVVQRASDHNAMLPVSIREGCFTVTEVSNAYETLLTGDWSTAAAEGVYRVELTPETGDITVTTADPEIKADIATRFGSVVRIEDGLHGLGVNDAPFFRTSREADPPPHWGGARIYNPSNGNVCSSGFEVRLRSNSSHGMLTASHCDPNGPDPQGPASHWRSGNSQNDYFFGNMTIWANYDRIDAAFLSGSPYENILYTDPDGLWRAVRSDDNPRDGEEVCTSGAIRKNHCNFVVTRVNADFCQGGTCTEGLAEARERDGRLGSFLGDSGGPVFSRPAPRNAQAHGLILGRGAEQGPREDILIIQKIVSIKQRFDADVVQGPESPGKPID